MRSRRDDCPLFDPERLARRDDPATSQEAAQRVGELRGRHFTAILGALVHGVALAVEEIEDRTELTAWQIGRRMKELEEAGLVRRTGERHVNRSGRSAFRWIRA